MGIRKKIPEEVWRAWQSRLECLPVASYSEIGGIGSSFHLYTLESNRTIHRSERYEEKHGLKTFCIDLDHKGKIVPFFVSHPTAKWALVQSISAFGKFDECIVLWGEGKYPEVS